ncbi:mannosyltransferase [Mucilaginibacter sp. HC2]|uniref:mannosyltransferase n=1 Tax=Mucilaginibacter inviolabilis TaxID=2714892 RepID=UPI0014094D1A|nr:mannosyltransferase [Mucilaginibacter inviolabilis]NHA07723.1 mannosyltransferase [Mucilaginibacter inviolabilis]
MKGISSSMFIPQTKKTNFFVFIVLLFYLFVAFKSSGYIQPDEHYQIIEFANYKLGLLPVDRLAWEFRSEIRSGLQPMICYVLFKLFGYLKVTDGYDLAFLLRAVTAIFSVIVIRQFIEAYRPCVAKSLQVYFIFLSYLLWFLPYINIRFSSETWSGLFLMLTLTAIQKYRYQEYKKSYFIIGLLLGISIIFRYQSALFVIGILFWFVFVKKIKIQNFLTILLAVLLVMATGLVIDYWLYGKFTFSIYNYFYVNLIQGVSNKFGTSPFYQYALYILNAPSILFGILIIIAFFTLLYYDAKNLLFWVIIPFIIIHSIIPHKELRFLFPLVNLSPLLLILSYQKLYKNIIRIKLKPTHEKYVIGFIWSLFFVINIVGLFAIASTGAGLNETVVTEYIHRNYKEDKTNLIMNGGINPYVDWVIPKNSYYSSSGLHIDRITTIWQSDLLEHKKRQYKNLLIIYKNDITGPQSLRFMKSIGLIKVYQNIPELTTMIYNFYKPSLNNSQIFVYEFK